MKSAAKITLSDEEVELMANTKFILTKRAIIDKISLLFGQLAESNSTLLQHYRSALPQEVFTLSPKISKGENYQQLPYVILDYPRLYEKNNIFTIRTMFWWGNFYSITLQLSGIYKNMFQQRIIDKISIAEKVDLFICVNEDQWQHHFEEDNYVLLKNKNAVEIMEIISQQHFIKLAVKFSLDHWEQLPEKLSAAFESMIALLQN